MNFRCSWTDAGRARLVLEASVQDVMRKMRSLFSQVNTEPSILN
jgi:hypothetical protein